MRLFIKLLLPNLLIEHSCENVAFFFPPPLPLASWHSSYMAERILFYLGSDAGCKSGYHTKGFGGHLMFLRVLAIASHVPPGSFWFLASFGFYIAVARNKMPFPSLGCKTKELNRKKIIY